MVLLSFALAAILGAGIGAALVWAAFKRRALRRRRPSPPAHPDLPARDVPFTPSIDEVATGLDFVLAVGSELRLLGIYAGREDADSLEARWRAPHVDPGYLPRTMPSVLTLQLSRARLVDPAELATGLRLALGPASAEVEAQARADQPAAQTPAAPAAINENPFDLEDEALTRPGGSGAARGSSSNFPDEEAIAARIVAVPWTGPFGWRGIVVAQPMGADRSRDLERIDTAITEIGMRLGVHCEVASRPVEAPSDPGTEPSGWTITQPAAEPAAPAPVVEIPVAQARLTRATARMADALMSPRRVRDVVRATVALLADGLATDRCYAIEVEGLHLLPVEHEKRSEAAASAIGVDFGDSFLPALRLRVGQTITAISLDANSGQLIVPEHAAVRLGSVSRMIVPVLEKGRIVVVYVAEWIDLAKRLTNADVTFAEQVVARSAVARERMLQFDALAEQAAHARAEQEQMADALEQLQALVTASPDALIGIDDDGNVAFANPAAARLLGKMEFELMGRPMRAVTSVLQGQDPETWERVMSANSPQSYYGAFQHDGCSIDVSVVPGLESSAFNRLVSLREIRLNDPVRGV